MAKARRVIIERKGSPEHLSVAFDGETPMFYGVDTVCLRRDMARRFGHPLPSPGEAEALQERAEIAERDAERLRKTNVALQEANEQLAWNVGDREKTINGLTMILGLREELAKAKDENAILGRDLRIRTTQRDGYRRAVNSLEAGLAAREKVVEALPSAAALRECAAQGRSKMNWSITSDMLDRAADALAAHEAGKGEQAYTVRTGTPSNAVEFTGGGTGKAEPAATVPEGRKVIEITQRNWGYAISLPSDTSQWLAAEVFIALTGVTIPRGKTRQFYLADAPPGPVAEPEPAKWTPDKCACCGKPK